MKDSIRNDLKKLCYHIIENKDAESLSEQLTQVQMLYERLVVLNYLEENKPSAKVSEPVPAESQQAAAADTQPVHPSKPSPAKAQDEKKPADFGVPENQLEEAPFKASSTPVEKEEKPETPKKDSLTESKAEKAEAEGQASLNDRLGQGTIDIGLNDRIAFVKHLFGGEQKDFNRVLSQLNTFSSFKEAEQFIGNMVKPDYDWTDKEEYEERLMDLLRKRYGDE